MISGYMGEDGSDDLIVTSTAGDVATLAPDLPEHWTPLRTPNIYMLGRKGRYNAYAQLLG
jgi:hypothetical protein